MHLNTLLCILLPLTTFFLLLKRLSDSPGRAFQSSCLELVNLFGPAQIQFHHVLCNKMCPFAALHLLFFVLHYDRTLRAGPEHGMLFSPLLDKGKQTISPGTLNGCQQTCESPRVQLPLFLGSAIQHTSFLLKAKCFCAPPELLIK